MASLGTFTAAAREYDPGSSEPDTFEFYDQTFTVVGEIPAMIELTITAALAGKAGGVEGDAALYAALRAALTVPEREVDGRRTAPDDSRWETFYQLAVEKDAPSELLTTIALRVMGAQMGRPTGQRPTSSSGPLPTSTNSSSPASDTPDSPA